jgi:hypothetical protein
MTGAGELPWTLPIPPISASPVLLLFPSLSSPLLHLFSFPSLSTFDWESPLASPSLLIFVDLGARQVGSCQVIPVKLFICRPFFIHLRQGFPVRSRALSPALIAPWFAFGPSLWVTSGAMVLAPVLFVNPLSVPSAAPSSLRKPLVRFLDVCALLHKRRLMERMRGW